MAGLNDSLFSSKKEDWATPWDLFKEWDAKEGPFCLDVCATAQNAKCSRFYSPAENGLMLPWFGKCWLNPPYGRKITQWLEKALFEVQSKRADKVCCLIPARTDTKWWHDIVIPHGKTHFLRGRVRFEGAKYPAPFQSAIVILG